MVKANEKEILRKIWKIISLCSVINTTRLFFKGRTNKLTNVCLGICWCTYIYEFVNKHKKH